MQIQLRWNENDPEDKKLMDYLMRGFEKIGCWSCDLPPERSIYKKVLTYKGRNMDSKNTDK